MLVVAALFSEPAAIRVNGQALGSLGREILRGGVFVRCYPAILSRYLRCPNVKREYFHLVVPPEWTSELILTGLWPCVPYVGAQVFHDHKFRV